MSRSLAMPPPLKDGRFRLPSLVALAWICRTVIAWIRGPGREAFLDAVTRTAHQIRRNMVARRILSFPHFLFLFWVVILLWGERWVFESKVEKCEWKRWEKWPKQAHPHHLVLIADPQITDPHSYPGRPWPLSSLTVLVTDNYLRRGYRALQRQVRPDSVFFLGDLFDGGREWRTRHGIQFVDPKWGSSRSDAEKKWLKTWRRKYGDDFWIREYRRFSDIFFKPFNEGGGVPGPYQRGRKLVASLPGNHDLGFGAQIQVPVRDRFSAFFGDPNRVDVVGNHSIVSVDTVSLSADTSPYRESHDLHAIYGPALEFLDEVRASKRKAVQEELGVWHGGDRGPKLRHDVEDVYHTDVTRTPRDPGPGAADLPTILLTHVPLYRPAGTPCGPQRERWPPSEAAPNRDGRADPTVRDDRNAISIAAGYQYQNVLGEADSIRLVEKVGNVVHVFSGDDHDYCEVAHSAAKGHVREITVKSFSMAMGIPTPGFLMVSLYNPVDAEGGPMPGSAETTLQTHLCLLPNQFRTYMRYVTFGLVSLVLLSIRAVLVPVLHLTPFALEPERTVSRPSWSASASVLPVYGEKAKTEPPERTPLRGHSAGAASGLRGQHAAADGSNSNSRWGSSRKSRAGQRWGIGLDGGGGGGGVGGGRGPRIKLEDPFYDGGKSWRGGQGRRQLQVLGRELWTTTWRLGWMTVLFWGYLARRG